MIDKLLEVVNAQSNTRSTSFLIIEEYITYSIYIINKRTLIYKKNGQNKELKSMAYILDGGE